MGNISEKEKIGITFMAIFIYPFKLLFDIIKGIASFFGLIKKTPDEKIVEQKEEL